MSEQITLIAACPCSAKAESAIVNLRGMGFRTKDLSVFGRMCASEERVVGLCVSGGYSVACGDSSGFWERMWEYLGDGGFFNVPLIGPIAIAGRFVGEFVAAADDRTPCGGLSELGTAICRLGIAKENVPRYEVKIRANECALVAVGTREQVACAKTTLYSLGISEFVTGTNGHGTHRLPGLGEYELEAPQ